MYSLSLTVEAEQDLGSIYLIGYERWGLVQADQYYDDILAHFALLCENPYLFQSVEEIRPGYRRSVCRKHAIYYRVVGDVVEVAGLVRQQHRFHG